LNRDVFAKRGLKQIPGDGPLSWSVPGCVAGWDDLRQRFGRLPFDKTLAAAIDYAESGFPVSEIIAGSWRGSEKSLSKWANSAKTFLPDGRAPREAEIYRNPNLARTLRAIASEGCDVYYRGRIAQHIVSFSEAHGGYFSLKDFADHQSEWVDPVSTSY